MSDESKQQLFWLLTVLILVLFAGAVFFFNKDLPKNQQANLNDSAKLSGRTYTVFYTSGVFSPTNLQINTGDTVRFLNDGLLSLRVVSDLQPDFGNLPEFDSVSEIPPKGVFIHTFLRRGIFDYHNSKKAEQAGTIIVK